VREHSFNEAGYRDLIGRFKDAGYAFSGFQGFEPEGAKLILRHDIDFSMRLARRQAEVNAELGASATFFFLLTSEHYNLASAEGKSALKAIVACGQAIGVHLDIAAYPEDVDLEAAASKECDLLADLAETKMEAVSFHRPVQRLLGGESDLAGLPHAYGLKFFTQIDYCSDSRGRFHHGSPFDRAAFHDRAPMQLLLHPIWWMREAEVEPIAALLEVEAERCAALRASLAANSTPFASYLAEPTPNEA